MLSFISYPMQMIGFLQKNVSPREIAAGVCLAMFLGFIPWNGAMATVLLIFFFVFRLNRLSMLLTIPLFKLIYIAGLYKLTGPIGQYLLVDAAYLNGFWRWLTGLPVVAFLDINNTLVAGGLVLSTVLTIPVYFISKMIAAYLKHKLSEKVSATKLGKHVAKLRADYNAEIMTGAGPEAAARKNVKTYIAGKVKSRIFSRKAESEGVISKRFNIRGIAIVVIMLLAIQFGVAYIVSPTASSFIIDAINKVSGSKIYIDTLRIWPLTLSLTLRGFEIYDPENPDKRVAQAEKVSVRISPVALLSRRLVFSNVTMVNAEITVEGAKGGSFNVQKLGATGGSKGMDLGSVFGFIQKKQDWFSKGFEMMKKNFSKAAVEKEKAAKKDSKKVTKEVEETPKGDIVTFKTGRDRYIFEIKDLYVRRAIIHFKADSDLVELDRATLRLGNVAFDPTAGADVGLFEVRGSLKKEGEPMGSMDLYYSHGFDKRGKTGQFDVVLKDVDVKAIKFVYKDSLPLNVDQGIVTLHSETKIVNDEIDSRNSLVLKDYKFSPKGGMNMAFGFVPMPALCEALNASENLSLKFDITGTLDKPQFKGLEETIMKIVKPRLDAIGDSFKKQGVSAIGDFLKKFQKSE